MSNTRRDCLGGLIGGALLGAVAGATAQPARFSDRPLSLYVGFAPGGAADTVARVLADEMSKVLGQRVVVENRVGASGNIATQLALALPADGTTLVFAGIHFATNPHLLNVRYDPRNDLQMVSQVTSVPVVMLASLKSGIKTLADAAAQARKIHGGMRVGSGGVGTSSHLALELFKRATGIAAIHIPYKGGAPANQDLVAGEIDVMFDLMSGTLRTLIDSQRVQPLAVMQATRVPALADVKNAREFGLPPATYIRSWQGLAVKSGTPQYLVDRLHQAVTAAVATTAFRARASVLGSEVVASRHAAEFQNYYFAEMDRWGGLLRDAKITLQ